MGNNLIQMDKKDALGIHIVPIDEVNYPIALQDFVRWDASNLVARPLLYDANAANFLGECEDVVPVDLYGAVFDIGGGGVLPNPPRHVAKVKRYGLREIAIHATDNANPYNPVYMSNADGDPQTVTTVDPGSGTAVGYISPDQAKVANATSGLKVRIIYHANYPADPVN